MRDILTLFKALSDGTRLRILFLLSKRTLCVCEIREVLQLAFSTVSQHLSILREAGLIIDHKEGKRVNCQRNDDPQAEQVQAIFKLIDQWMEQDIQAKKDIQAAKVDRYQLRSMQTLPIIDQLTTKETV